MIIVIVPSVTARQEQWSSNLRHCFELKPSCSVFDVGLQGCLYNDPECSAHTNLYTYSGKENIWHSNGQLFVRQ